MVNEPETGLPKQCLRQASGIALGLLRRQPFSPRDPHPVGFARPGAFVMAFSGLPADVATCGGEARAETVARITLPTYHEAALARLGTFIAGKLADRQTGGVPVWVAQA
ncbi:MAG: hypothetical protein OHK0018_16050 [Erythrobacter tepidarius]